MNTRIKLRTIYKLCFFVYVGNRSLRDQYPRLDFLFGLVVTGFLAPSRSEPATPPRNRSKLAV